MSEVYVADYDYGKHANCMDLLNLIAATVEDRAYSVKEFFEKLEERKYPVTLSDIEADEEIMSNARFADLVSQAKTNLIPFENYASTQSDDINIGDIVDKKQKGGFFDGLFKSKKKDTVASDPDIAALERMENNEIEDEEDDELIEDIMFTAAEDGAVNLVSKPKVKTTPVDAVVKETPLDNDTKFKMNKVCELLKDMVPKNTIITTSYNYQNSAFFSVQLQFPNGTTNVITVDAGTFLPDYYSIISADLNGMGAIPLDDPIAQKIIDTPMYKLTDEETKYITDTYYLDNLGLYYVYDFSTLKGMSKFDATNAKKFSDILTNIGEKFQDPATGDVPRFRFKEFNWIDDFTIISDDKVKMPLAYSGENSSWIGNVEVVVEDGKVKTCTSINKPNPAVVQNIA